MVSDHKKDQQERMVQSRKRASGIDSYVDMIPSRFYLGSESQVHNHKGPGLDPSRAQTTSQLVCQAAAAETRKGTDAGAAGSGKGGKQNKKKNKQKGGAGKAPRDQGELKAKLAERIAELKESRRNKQSETDKAKSKKAKPVGEKEAKPVPKEEKGKREKPSAGSGDVDEVAEAGRLTFNTKKADVPFELSVGRPGDKAKKLHAQLRKAEMNQQKLTQAEQQGQGEEARRSLELQKALKRARGEKVHDDTRKLRKAHKALTVKKQKGKQGWEERVKNEREAEKQQQQKRKDNINAKRDKKRAKKFAHIKPLAED